MKYLILGAGGMAGHTIANYLIEQGENVHGIERRSLGFCKTFVMDVTDFESLKNIVVENKYDYIINCIGLLNQVAEQNIHMAIMLNSYLPHFLVHITSDINTKIIQMSTDCVFSGRKGNYTEMDFPDGESIYDRTKALGEINDTKNLTFRNSIIGADINANGIGLFNWFMKQDAEINGYEKSLWTGVTTLTLAKAMHCASKENLSGLFNLVNNEIISKYDLIILLNKHFKRNMIVHCVDGIIQNKSLIRTRNDLGYQIPSYEVQIKEMADWLINHKQLYPHYKLRTDE